MVDAAVSLWATIDFTIFRASAFARDVDWYVLKNFDQV